MSDIVSATFDEVLTPGPLSVKSRQPQVSTNRAQTVLNPPQILAVGNGQSSELKARVRADANSKSFQGRIKAAGGSEFGPTISFKNSRSILFKGLTAGMTYVFELCAIDGSLGQSDWSEPATKMAQ